jgi:phosphoglycerol transferase MdoB-like AlkP superfamily enzyme
MDEFVLIFTSIGCFSVVMALVFFSFFAYLRYMRYKETITLAEKGLVYPGHGANGKGTLRWGIAFAGLGLALCMGLYPIGWAVGGSEFPLNFGPWMLIGLIPAFFGVSLVAIYYLTMDKNASAVESSGSEEAADPKEGD